MIKIKNVTKQFHNNLVLDKINLDIEEGALVRIVGQNGCGKSTLLKILAGLLKADDGKITFDKSKNIGAVIENPAFIENETLEYNLKFLYELKNKFDYDKVNKLCQYFNLDLKSKTLIKKYSLGMRQKAAIIQAVMEEQNIILLDEPTRGLDQASIRQFNQLIDQLHQQNKTIIICAHDGVDAIKFTKILKLENGKISKIS